MRIDNIPFGTTDWSTIAKSSHNGETGVALWRTKQFGDIRVRLVEYSAGYAADHWCSKGHIIFCLEGGMTTELKDGRSFELNAGQSYQVADDDGEHRSHTAKGAKLFIVD